MIKKVLKYCLPTMFSFMLVSLYSVIDGIFIGNNVGDHGLAAINIAWPIVAFITALGVGIGMGGSVLISYERKNNKQDINTHILNVCITSLIMIAIIISSILIFLYPTILKILKANGDTYVHASNYSVIVIIGAMFQIIGAGIIPILRNYNLSIQAMFCMIIGTITNVIINYILIYVYSLGISGAAIGTIIAQLSVSIIAILILKIKINYKYHYKWDLNIFKKIFKIAITGFCISLAPSIVLIFTNLQCLNYGNDAVVACYCVIAYIAFPAQALLTGVGDGVQPLISYYAGLNDTHNLNKVIKIGRTINITLSIILTIIIISILSYIPVWFNLSQEGSYHFHQGMIIYTLSFIFFGLFRFNLCYLNASLNVKKAITLILSESIIVTPLLLYILPILFNINGIWLSSPLSIILMLIIYYIWKD